MHISPSWVIRVSPLRLVILMRLHAARRHTYLQQQKSGVWWASTIGGNRTESWSYKTARIQAKVFWAHAPPQGPCENLVCALKLLANQQTGGDSLSWIRSSGVFQEQSRYKIMDELRRGGEDRRLGKEIGGDQSGRAQF